MSHLARSLRPFAFATGLASLLACDQAGTSVVPPAAGPDTVGTPVPTNDALVRATPLGIQPLWIPVRPHAPAGLIRGSAWYALDLDSGLTYVVTLKDSASTNASMELHDADSSLLRESTELPWAPGGRTLGLQYESNRRERVYLVVHGAVPSLLAIRVETAPGQDAGPDAYEDLDSGSESVGGPALAPDSQWINRTLHRTSGGVMEEGDLFRIPADSGHLHILHLVARGNMPTVEFLPWGMLPVDTAWTHSDERNTRIASLTFAAYRKGTFHLRVRPSGPDFKPVHYRIAATRREGIPDRIYPDVHESDDTPESASLLYVAPQPQVRTLHVDRGIPDVDEIMVLAPSDGPQVLEIHDSLRAVSVEAFHPDGTPASLPETMTGSVRCFAFVGLVGNPIRLRLTDLTGAGVRYRIDLRKP